MDNKLPMTPLEYYGRHRDDCIMGHGSFDEPPETCSCGFDEAVAMSAQAPGMEAILRECRPYVAMEVGEQDNNTVADALALLDQIDAALQAAERGKA